jgi:nucleotidyltransferase/DNA polymerase involved in DNA repair
MAVILHVDMDAFFASVELLHHPEWRGKPLVVGAYPHERGVVSTCSYEARKFGIHSAMASSRAYELCPQAVFTHPNMELYNEISRKAFEVFYRFSPYVEAVSIDEAFIDITGSLHLFSNNDAPQNHSSIDLIAAKRLGENLKAEIQKTCSLTCSVGIAPNRLLAKIGSEWNKPDGLTLMPFNPDEAAALLRPKKASILWGVGKKTVEELKPYGIITCGDIQRLAASSSNFGGLAGILGEGAAATLTEFAFGRSDDKVYWQESEEKSVSREHTFSKDECDMENVRRKLMELVSEVGTRFRKEERWACTAKIKIRDASFQTITRQMKFPSPARDEQTLRETALKLFDKEKPLLSSVRLIGFGVGEFVASAETPQMTLFEDADTSKRLKREKLSQALDILRARGVEI